MQAWMTGEELLHRGWDVHYASEMNDVPQPNVVDGITLHGLPEHPSYWKGNRKPLRKLMHELQPDVIYTRVFDPYVGHVVMEKPPGAFVIWNMASGNDGKPWPFLVHGWRTQPGFSYFKRFPVMVYANYIARQGRRGADLILAQQRDQQNDLARIGLSSEIVRNSHKPVPEEEVQTHDGEPLILWADSIKDIKRPEIFLELVRRCKDLPATFLMLGRILHENYRSLVDQAVRDLPNFRYGGFIPLNEVETYFRQAHMHMKTSLPIEGFPNTFIQSWLHGIPIVSYQGDPESLLRDGGLGVRADSIDELEKAVRELVNNSAKRREIGARARAFAVREFDLKNNVDKLERLLSERGVRLPAK